jgi:putative SOS response-associated peptidase YedK
LPPPVLHDWLHGSPEAAAAIALAVEPPPQLHWHAVSRAVGNPRSNGPQLVAPV